MNLEDSEEFVVTAVIRSFKKFFRISRRSDSIEILSICLPLIYHPNYWISSGIFHLNRLLNIHRCEETDATFGLG